MTTNNIKQQPFLRQQRMFPYNNLKDLSGQIDQSYVDIANKVNSRIIGTHASSSSVVTGEEWYLSGQEGQPNKQQSMRQVYQFTNFGNIPHNLNLGEISQFTKPYGSFTDGEKFYGILYSSNIAGIAGLVTFYIDSEDIIIVVGGGSPSIQAGIIVLEWLSKY